MKEKKVEAVISLLDDRDNAVWENIKKTILEAGVDLLPRLIKEQQSNQNPIVQDRADILIRTLYFGELKEKLQNWKNHNSNDLLEGMLLLASYENPGIDHYVFEHVLDQLYAKAWVNLGASSSPMEKIKLFNGAFFDSLGFRPTHPDKFHDLENSLIDVVFEKRRGNPISLCIIYMLIAQKMKIPVYGVNLPNLFVLIHDDPEARFYINVFNRGSFFTRHEIDAFLARLGIESIPPYYEPCNHEMIVRRVLRNMMVSYEQMQQPERVREIYELLEIWE